MPGMSGLETYSKTRLSFFGPIIMVTVRNSEQDKIHALDSGADDYVVKPFSIGELLARIGAALRRSGPEEPLPKVESPQFLGKTATAQAPEFIAEDGRNRDRDLVPKHSRAVRQGIPGPCP